jgi:rhodanese-related sulfurtransferase
MHPSAVPTVDVNDLPADAVLLDVREDDEWAAGHIAGAVHVPMMRVPQQLQFDPGPVTPDVPVVVVCKVGGRSAQASMYLLQQGHDVVNLDGGMLDWEDAGRPMVSENGAPAQVI